MKNKHYFIITFGCQANEADSERIAAYFRKKGYQLASTKQKADLVIINTCSVRRAAEDKVLGAIRNLQKTKKQKQIIITGCILYHDKEWLKKEFPKNVQFSPLKRLINSSLDPQRKNKKHAWVQIMEGCNNLCSYCVVPFSRGREKSRPIEEILCEVKMIVKRGIKEITLLGQNVNSYHKNSDIKVKNKLLQEKIEELKKRYKNNFAILLSLLNEIKGLKKIKFFTSNPHDLSNGIIQVLKLPKIERYLHLPVQSGDDEILKKMNRKYTSEQYLKLVKKIKKEIPDIEIGTDIIVGFPGETKKQFENTVKLCKQIGFCLAYIAKYSPRPGTAAYRLEDNIPFVEKKRRREILNKLINQK